MTIDVFEIDGKKFGLLLGDNKFIVTGTDFIHWVYDCKDFVTATDGQDYSLEALINLSKPIKYSEFGHYWNVKQRIRENYYLLQHTAKEIGVEQQFPAWGE